MTEAVAVGLPINLFIMDHPLRSMGHGVRIELFCPRDIITQVVPKKQKQTKNLFLQIASQVSNSSLPATYKGL